MMMFHGKSQREIERLKVAGQEIMDPSRTGERKRRRPGYDGVCLNYKVIGTGPWNWEKLVSGRE